MVPVYPASSTTGANDSVNWVAGEPVSRRIRSTSERTACRSSVPRTVAAGPENGSAGASGSRLDHPCPSDTTASSRIAPCRSERGAGVEAVVEPDVEPPYEPREDRVAGRHRPDGYTAERGTSAA